MGNCWYNELDVGKFYFGSIQITKTGKQCLKWKMQKKYSDGDFKNEGCITIYITILYRYLNFN